MPPESRKSKTSKLEIIIDLLRVIAWPLVVLLIIVIFWRPIYLTVNEIPNVINKSESITIGSLSLKIEKNSSIRPSEKVKELLKTISPNAVDVLISSEGTTEYFHKNEVLYGKQRFKELIKQGLYVEIDSIHLSEDEFKNKYSYGVMPTALGIEVRSYLMEILQGLINEI